MSAAIALYLEGLQRLVLVVGDFACHVGNVHGALDNVEIVWDQLDIDGLVEESILIEVPTR